MTFVCVIYIDWTVIIIKMTLYLTQLSKKSCVCHSFYGNNFRARSYTVFSACMTGCHQEGH